jgi:TPR repeat protein
MAPARRRGRPSAANNKLGMRLAVMMGARRSAEKVFRDTIGGGDIDALNNLGFLLANQGRHEEAERLYRRGIDAGNPFAVANLGLLLQQTGRPPGPGLGRRSYSYRTPPGTATSADTPGAQWGRGWGW